MRHQLTAFAGVVVVVLATAAPMRGQRAAAHPDLQGVWNFSTITPLERPAEFAGKEFLTDAEAAQYEARTVQRNNRDNREGSADADVASAYNEFWWDRGVHAARVNGRTRTSLIVDPPDGRIPALTAEGAAAGRGACRGEAAAPCRRPRGSLARRALPAVQRRAADVVGPVQQLRADPAERRPRRDPQRDDPRRAHRAARRPPASAGGDPQAARRLARPLGGQHAGRRDDEFLATRPTCADPASGCA